MLHILEVPSRLSQGCHGVTIRTAMSHTRGTTLEECRLYWYSPFASLADPLQLPRHRSRLGLRMRLGASRTCRRPTPSGHPPGSQARGRDALRTLFRAAPALGMAVVRRDHLLFAPQVHNQGLATSISILVKPMGQKGRELPSQVAGGYTSGRRAGGGAGAQ